MSRMKPLPRLITFETGAGGIPPALWAALTEAYPVLMGILRKDKRATGVGVLEWKTAWIIRPPRELTVAQANDKSFGYNNLTSSEPCRIIYMVRSNGEYKQFHHWSVAEACGDPEIVDPSDQPVFIMHVKCNGPMMDRKIEIELYRNSGQIERWRRMIIAKARQTVGIKLR